ncbi:MAG TPA: hypothetical protein VLV54_17540 [Thermoanaerobaculia bacterium]|nr:hypothetical protein [Thermoanaerobaculia bacterium]
MFSYFLKERQGQNANRPPLQRGGTRRGLCFAALSCLPLMASACRGGMTFDEAQASFRSFSECALIEDFPGRNLTLKDAWLQNIVAEPSQGNSKDYAGAQSPSSSMPADQSKDEEYVVTGVVRAVTGNGSLSRELAMLRVRKVLDEYKVVSWATTIDRSEKRDLQPLKAELRSKLYLGRCSF